MNRRLFLRNTGIIAASFVILPSALTYKRKWKFPKHRLESDSILMVDPDEGLLLDSGKYRGQTIWFKGGELIEPLSGPVVEFNPSEFNYRGIFV